MGCGMETSNVYLTEICLSICLSMDKKRIFYLSIIITVKSFSDGLQVFFEGSGTYYFRCPPDSLTKFLMFNLTVNNTDTFRVNCLNFPCQTSLGGQVISNISGYYIPIPENVLTKPRLTNGVKCTYANDPSQVLVLNYDVLIVAKPRDVSCDPPILIADESIITVTCKTSKVFPQASCTFSCEGSSAQGNITYYHTSYTDSYLYYQSSCVWTSSLSNFVAGDYTFNVYLYIINSSFNIFGVNGTSPSVQLKLPNVSLSSECFNNQNIVDGYVKPESTVSCLCNLDELVNPRGNMKWIDNAGADVSTFKNSTMANLDIVPFNGSKTYQCVYTSSLKNGNVSVSYTVNYAFGPNKCTVDLENSIQTIWSKCDAKSINITIVCDVNQTDVSPNMSSMIDVNSSRSPLLKSVLTNSVFRSKYESSLIKAGNYTIMCQAQNFMFSDVNKYCLYSQVLQVREPPTSFPNFIVKKIDGYTTTFTEIVESEKYTVECSVDGGVPFVDNITVSCGNISGIMQTGHIFSSPMTFTRNMTGQMCTCIAQHLTGCYTQNKTENVLNIQFPSIVKNLSVNKTILTNGSSIRFVCEADGNPLPKIELMKHNNNIFQNNSGNVISFTKDVDCKDSGFYQCRANNGLNIGDTISQEKNVTIYIMCPLQYNNTESILTNFLAKPGDVFTTSFVIYGYPYPDNFTLFKYNYVKTSFIEVYVLKVNDNAYQNTDKNILINFSLGELPYGTVQLSIFNLTSVDFTNYRLVIFQNKSQNLNFTFNIAEKLVQLIAKDDGHNVSVIVGCVIGGLVMIALIITAIFIARKYKISLKCEKRKQAKQKQKNNYSDLEVAQAQQGHYYDTPRFSSINTSSAKTNYANIDIPLKEQVESPYEKVD